MIKIENLNYCYPGSKALVLDSIDLTIEPGSLFGLLGPNGAGKTTLISLLTGVLTPPSGAITIGGHCLPRALPAAKQLMGYVPQDYAFYPALTALENLQFFAGMQGVPKAIKNTRIDYCLDFCQLQGVAQQRASEFSGGLKRRLNIAIGLLTDPEILVFDEPTVSIDPQSRAFILQQIKALQLQGKTIIYTSHYMDEVEQLCDHLAIIDHGKILRKGTVQSLQQEQHQLVVGFEGAIDDAVRVQLAQRFNFKANDQQLVFQNVVGMASYNDVMGQVQALNIPVTSIAYGRNNLEQVFLDLTSKELRD